MLTLICPVGALHVGGTNAAEKQATITFPRRVEVPLARCMGRAFAWMLVCPATVAVWLSLVASESDHATPDLPASSKVQARGYTKQIQT